MKKMVRCLRSLLMVGWLLAALSVTAEAAPTAAEITGEIERLTLNNPADVYSGGVMIVGGSQVILPKNLLIDLPANRLPLQQIFAQAPAACKANGESGLAKADKCNASGTGGFATLSGVHSTAGNIIAGDMLLKAATPIDPDEDTQSLHDRLSVIGADLLAETVDRLVAGTLTAEKQDDSLTTYAPLLKKEDGLIDWTRDPRGVKDLVRGMAPWPGAFTWFEGKMLKVYRVAPAEGNGPAGTVLAAAAGGIEVACGNGSVVITDLQLEGKKRLPAREFLAGCRMEPGTILGRKEDTRVT